MHEPAVPKSRLNTQANNGALFRQDPLDISHVARGQSGREARASLQAVDNVGCFRLGDVIVDTLRILCSLNIATPLACLGLVFGNVD